MTALLLTALALASVDLSPPATVGDAPAAAVADLAAPTVGATLDKVDAHIGDRLTLTLTAVAKTGIAVTLPGHLDLGKFELLDREDGEPAGRDLGDGRRSHRFVLGVATYEVGSIELPPVELSYLNQQGEVRSVKTSPITVQIRGLVADQPNVDVQPIRPTRSAMVEDARIGKVARAGALGGLALFVAFIVYRLLRRRKREARAAELAMVPARPPDVVALERLRVLRSAGNFSYELYRPFFFAVAEVVRTYLGARFRFDSLELTTTELLGELGKRAPHLTGSRTEVVRFFEETDLVKFAKAGSTDESALRVIDAAESIVLFTTPALEQSAAAPLGPARPPMEISGG